MERPHIETVYKESQGEIEIRVKVIFEDFFEISGIGVNDDFLSWAEIRSGQWYF